jgi:hypothetical protein
MLETKSFILYVKVKKTYIVLEVRRHELMKATTLSCEPRYASLQVTGGNV